MISINKDTSSSSYGLIGKTLKHSFSQSFFEDFFKTHHILASYSNIELADETSLANFCKEKIFQYKGLNVTIPYKTSIIPFLKELTPEAERIGAVNVIKIIDNQLIGHNTDAFGFQQSIKPFLTNQHEKAMILGTGGASKAVEFVFKNLGIDCIFISRNKKENLTFSYDEINKTMVDACKCIVNTTPIGMFPNNDETIHFPYQFLTNSHLVIDLIYNPEETQFLRNAKLQGAKTLNGMSMLKYQAIEAWNYWNRI